MILISVIQQNNNTIEKKQQQCITNKKITAIKTRKEEHSNITNNQKQKLNSLQHSS